MMSYHDVIELVLNLLYPE